MVQTFQISKEDNGTSEQLSVYTEMIKVGKIVARPVFDREVLTKCYLNSTNRRCIDVKASVIAGMGYTFKDEEDAKKSGVIDFFNGLYSKDGSPKPFSTLLKDFWRDLEIYGASRLECVRIGSMIENLLLLSERRTGISIDRKTIYQFDQTRSKIKEFKRYGSNTKLANDTISISFDTPEDDYYGVPCYVSAIPSIMTANKIVEANMETLDNIIDPSLLLIITGYPVTTDELEACKSTLNGLKAKRSSAGMINFGNSDAKVIVENTGSKQQFEGNYLQELINISLEIMSLHGLTPELFGVLSNGGISSGEKASGALKIFLQTVVRPAQEYLSRLINDFIRKEFPKFSKENAFILNCIDITDSSEDATTELTKSQTYQTLISTGSKVLVDEYRKIYNLEPLSDIEWKNMLAGANGMSLELIKDGFNNEY